MLTIFLSKIYITDDAVPKTAVTTITNRWIDLAKDYTFTLEVDKIKKAIIGEEFAVLHNRLGKDITNKADWGRYIIRKVRKDRWELLDELGTELLDEIQDLEDRSKGPSKEWGL